MVYILFREDVLVNNNKLPISVLIMTQNEQDNIHHALESVCGQFDQIIVTDSYSEDNTVEICSKYTEVELYQNKFISWANQRTWMLENCSINNDIVFFLDADEYCTNEFIIELRNIINLKIQFDSVYLNLKLLFLNKHLKYAYGHPKIKRIFKREGLSFEGSGAREYANKEGIAINIKAPLMHHDRKPIGYWIAKHNNNAEREAIYYLKSIKIENYSNLPIKLRIKLWIRHSIWNRLPLLVRPIFYFIYRYIFQLGILDGVAGLIYCYLHAFWYQSLIDIKIIDMKHRSNK